MIERLKELNRTLRLLFFILGGLFALAKLTENKKILAEEDKYGYQTKEFDDIW